jgi:hypothetical protein
LKLNPCKSNHKHRGQIRVVWEMRHVTSSSYSAFSCCIPWITSELNCYFPIHFQQVPLTSQIMPTLRSHLHLDHAWTTLASIHSESHLAPHA